MWWLWWKMTEFVCVVTVQKLFALFVTNRSRHVRTVSYDSTWNFQAVIYGIPIRKIDPARSLRTKNKRITSSGSNKSAFLAASASASYIGSCRLVMSSRSTDSDASNACTVSCKILHIKWIDYTVIYSNVNSSNRFCIDTRYDKYMQIRNKINVVCILYFLFLLPSIFLKKCSVYRFKNDEQHRWFEIKSWLMWSQTVCGTFE